MSVSELKEQGQFVDDAESAFLIKNVREKEDSEIILRSPLDVSASAPTHARIHGDSHCFQNRCGDI